MSFLHFLLLVTSVYLFYYVINILIDLSSSKAENQAEINNSVQYDFDVESPPKEAELVLDDNIRGGRIQSLDSTQGSGGEKINEVDHTISGIDLSLETHLSNNLNTAQEHLNTNNKRRAGDNKL